MQKYYTIYKLTNKITRKSYIGQTTNDVKRRFTFHKSSAKRGSKTPLHEAISKYGAENFKIEIIDENISEETVDDCERFWIGKMKTRVPNGYNLQGGGKSAYGKYSSRYGYSSHGEIIMCDKKTGEELKIFSGVMDAERYLRNNGKVKANHWSITKCCIGKQKYAYGYKWKFKNSPLK